MQEATLKEMLDMADRYVYEEDLKTLVRGYIQEKANEGSRWAEMTRAVHFMLGGASPQLGRSAALIEMIMLILDIVDDLQDQDNLGKPWMTSPQPFTLNGLLALHVSFMSELLALQPPDARFAPGRDAGELLAQAIAGQQRDLNGSVATEADYLEMVAQKSGSLLRLTCYLGYALAPPADLATIDRINELASCIGIISQIQNDLNDVLRYDLKNDLLQKKKTLPILFLLEDEESAFPPLTDYYNGRITKEAFLRSKPDCIDYIHRSGCIEYCHIIQTLHIQKAEELLAAIPGDPQWKEAFKQLTFARK